MKVVWSWLQELCVLPDGIGPDEAAARLTDLGLEVESIEHVGAEVTGVVVAEVAWKKPHPKADKLTLVGVRTEEGGAITEVVCGASNVPDVGGKVAWARPGATLPGGITLGQKELKGVLSAGMLCAEDELGLSDDHEGIVVLDPALPLGADIATALHVHQTVLDVGVPANRADCLGHLGIARELVAAVGGHLRPPTPDLEPWTHDGEAIASRAKVVLHDPVGCPRYVARIIEGLSVGPSPMWMQQRLRAAGVRPISNLVDVTNYVMLELGQPLHAFDLAAVKDDRIEVRRAEGFATEMVTLDEVRRPLEPADLLICDGQRPVALAGVMGGLDSEVSDQTRAVLLESACFEPVGIRRTAKRLALHSEASHRFERGVDIEGAELVSQRASVLLAELGGGRIAPGAIDARGARPVPRQVTLRAGRATDLTGVVFTASDATAILGRLGIDCRPGSADAVVADIPSHRDDLSREVDLIEELIRIRGYDAVPATLPRTVAPPLARTDARPAIRRALTRSGLSEAITFGFTSPARVAAMQLPASDRRSRPLPLHNPMSVEQSVMRPMLLPNLLGAVARNLAFGVRTIDLFELGTVFLPNAPGTLPDEPIAVAAVICGQRRPWLGNAASADVFDLKGALEAVSFELGRELELTPTREAPYLHPGVAAWVTLEGKTVGALGEIHPRTRAAFDIDVPVFGFELDLGSALRLPNRQMQAIPRHPASTRDVSFFIDEHVPARRIREVIADHRADHLERVEILEDFRDPKYVPAGKKAMLWSITYRAHDRTLTDREVDGAHEPLVAHLLKTLSADRR